MMLRTVEVQVDQLSVQHQRVKEALHLESNQYHWNLEQELRAKLKGLRELRDALQKVKPSPPTLWDRLVIALFKWSFEPRFKVKE